MNDKVVVVGGANVDIKARMTGARRGHTSHPGMIWRVAGGVGRNVAANLAALQCQVTLIAPVGDDQDGHFLSGELMEAGIDVSNVIRFTTHNTGRYVAVFTDDGELDVAVSDMGIMNALTPEHMMARQAVFRDAKVICVDANVPEDTMGTVIREAKKASIPSVVLPVSVTKSARLRPYFRDIHTVVANRQEVSELSGMPVRNVNEVALAARALHEQGVARVIATMGPDGVYTVDEQRESHYPATVVPVIDVTGAGDAFTAGLVCGYCRGLDLPTLVHLGQSLSRRILTSTDSVLKGTLL